MTESQFASGGAPGPYWVRTNADGTHDVCGRQAVVVARNYRADREQAAREYCARLNFEAAQSAAAYASAAGPQLLSELIMARAVMNTMLHEATDEVARRVLERRIETASAAIARATGVGA